MTAIATQGTGLRHVRKTITFTGGPNLGNLGDSVPVFTTTGWVCIERAFLRVTNSLVCSVEASTSLGFGPNGTLGYASPLNSGFSPTTGKILGAAGWDTFYGSNYTAAGYLAFVATGDNIMISIDDLGGGANITGGTVVADVWYRPITDDGALAGDDIDTELVAAIWAYATRTLTALGFTLGAADLAADTITASKIAADAITAAKIATGAVDADALATDAVTEIVTAMLTTAMTESYNADGAAPTLAQALFLLIAALTEFSISGTTITAKKLDGSTTAATYTLNSSTAPTSRTRAT